MLNLTRIKGEKKKKDAVFLNVTHHILKTDCTEHYHAHSKPYLLERLLHLRWFLFLHYLNCEWFCFPTGLFVLCFISIKLHDGEQIIHFKVCLNDKFADQERKGCGMTLW